MCVEYLLINGIILSQPTDELIEEGGPVNAVWIYPDGSTHQGLYEIIPFGKWYMTHIGSLVIAPSW